MEKLIGPDSTLVMPPKYPDVYAAGKRDIQHLYHGPRKEMKSNHDMIHSARILFLACAIIQASANKATQRAWLLYQILKDADALDRARFGIYALDINDPRLPISHKLVPLAAAAKTDIQL